MEVSRKIESEHLLIGLLLNCPGQAWDIIKNIIKPDMFCDDFDKAAYKAIVELNEESEPISTLSLKLKLVEAGILPDIRDQRINQCWESSIAVGGDGVTSPVSMTAIIKDFLGLVVREQANRLDVGDMGAILEIIKSTDNIGRAADDIYPIDECLHDAEKMTQKAQAGDFQGVQTGYYDIDRIIPGFIAGDFVIIAGSTSVGKSTFALNLLDNMAVKKQMPVLYVSLEMDRVAIARRLVCQHSDILSIYDLKKGLMDEEKWLEWSNKSIHIYQAPVALLARPGLTVALLADITAQYHRKVELKAVFVDYLQLLSGGRRFSNETAEVTYISNSLKRMAIDLRIPVIALSQLRRIESNKIPELNDLRQSGSLEQDADVVLFVHRRKDDDGKFEDDTLLVIAKQRDGSPGYVKMLFRPKRMRFELNSTVKF